MPNFDLEGCFIALEAERAAEAVREVLTQLRQSSKALFGPKNFPSPYAFVDCWSTCELFIYCAPDACLDEFHKVVTRCNNSRAGLRVRSEEEQDIALPVAGGNSIEGKLALISCEVGGPGRELRIILLRGDPVTAYAALFTATTSAPYVIEVFESEFDNARFDRTPLGQAITIAEPRPKILLQGAANQDAISQLFPHRTRLFRTRPQLYTAFSREEPTV